MSDLNLTQLRVREDAQPQYPLLRQPSACQEWGHNEMLVLAAQGVASVTLLWRNDLIDMTDSQRQMAEKVYGALLHPKGPLRTQPGLLSQLREILSASPDMSLHGGRTRVSIGV